MAATDGLTAADKQRLWDRATAQQTYRAFRKAAALLVGLPQRLADQGGYALPHACFLNGVAAVLGAVECYLAEAQLARKADAQGLIERLLADSETMAEDALKKARRKARPLAQRKVGLYQASSVFEASSLCMWLRRAGLEARFAHHQGVPVVWVAPDEVAQAARELLEWFTAISDHRAHVRTALFGEGA